MVYGSMAVFQRRSVRTDMLEDWIVWGGDMPDLIEDLPEVLGVLHD